MPTMRLWALAAAVVVLAVVGAALGVEEFVLLALAGLIVGLWGAISCRWRARRVRGALQAVCTLPVPEAYVGDALRARLTLSASASLPPVRITDPARCWSVSHPGLGGRPVAARWPAPGGGTGSARRRAGRDAATGTVALRAVAAGETVALAVPVPTGRRGVLTFDGVGVWCDDPFGLFLAPAGKGSDARVLVCPVPASTHAEPAPGRRAGARPVVSPLGPAGRTAGDELDWLRPYVPGDRLTRLHWQALARTGDLVVREFTAGDSGRLALLVDVRPGTDDALFEAAVAQAAGLGVRALVAGSAVELCTSAGERLDVAPGADGPRALLRALAMVGPTLPRRDAVSRWGAGDADSALWATDNIADAGQVFVTARPGDEVLPAAVSHRTAVVVVR